MWLNNYSEELTVECRNVGKHYLSSFEASSTTWGPPTALEPGQSAPVAPPPCWQLWSSSNILKELIEGASTI